MALNAPLQFLILLVASWLGRRQGEAIEYLRAENRVLRAHLGTKRLRFTNAERRLLADKGKPLGRKLLAEMASLATPETILRWYRQQVVAKYDGTVRRRGPGRPCSQIEAVELLLTIARDNPYYPETRPASIFARYAVHGQTGSRSVRRAFYRRVDAPSDDPVSHRDGCLSNQRADGPQVQYLQEEVRNLSS